MPGLCDAEGTAIGEAALSRAALTVPAAQGTALQADLEPQTTPCLLCSHSPWTFTGSAGGTLHDFSSHVSPRAGIFAPCRHPGPAVFHFVSAPWRGGRRSRCPAPRHGQRCSQAPARGWALLHSRRRLGRAKPQPSLVLSSGDSPFPSRAPRRHQEQGNRVTNQRRGEAGPQNRSQTFPVLA